MSRYSLLTQFIWMVERWADALNTQLQHRRVQSQLRDIRRQAA